MKKTKVSAVITYKNGSIELLSGSKNIDIILELIKRKTKHRISTVVSMYFREKNND